MARKLIVLPESHTMGRRRQAALYAKEQTGSVKLFLEGIRKKEADKASSSLGYPVTPLEHGILPAVMSPFIAANGTLRSNAFLWSLANRRKDSAARKFVEDEKDVAAHVSGSPRGKIRLDEVKLLLGRDAAFSANATLYVKPFDELFGDSLNEILDAGPKGIPPILSGALRLLAKTLPPSTLRDLEVSVLSEINGLFGSKYGFALSITHDADYGTVEDFVPLVESSKPLGLYLKVTDVLNRLKELREMYMAYAVAREEFDLGVLNVGLAHLSRGSRMLEIFQKCDIESIIR